MGGCTEECWTKVEEGILLLITNYNNVRGGIDTEEIVKKLFENKRLDESRVGAFYFIGNKIVSNDADMRDGESYGGYVNYSSHWDLWSAFLKEYPEYEFLDYDYFPRGRVIFDRNKWKYILYIDPKLNNPKYLNKIESQYHLNKDAYEIGKDEHYQSQQQPHDVDDDELEDDVIFTESLDHYIKRETY